PLYTRSLYTGARRIRTPLYTGPLYAGSLYTGALYTGARRIRTPLYTGSLYAGSLYTGAVYTRPALYGLPRHGVGVDRRFGQVCPAQQIVELLGGVIARKEQLFSIRLLLHLSRQLYHSPNCLSTRWKVGLTAPPVVYSAQKLL